MHHLRNSILTKPSLDIRHRLLEERMFDEYTSSNAESEHSALKSKSLGISNLTSLTDLFIKSMKAAETRGNDKKLYNEGDLETVHSKSHAVLSQHVTRYCFKEMMRRVELSLRCISKQNNRSQWEVIYMPTQQDALQTNPTLHYLPRIKRKRYVQIYNGVLCCSCKTMQRYGYPCHHLLHVIQCRNINDFKLDWIHIRWYKRYLIEHHEPATSNTTQTQYQYLYDQHLNGLPCTARMLDDSNISFPVLKGPTNMHVQPHMFEIPDFQLLCRKTGQLWHEQNKSSNETLNAILRKSDPNTVEKEIYLSQTQEEEYALDDDNNINEDCQYPCNMSADCFALFKRAQSLTEGNKNKQQELHNLLSHFVTQNEIDHEDNNIVLANRNEGEVTTISSNKMIYKTSGGPKRKRYKSFHEKH